MIQLTIYFIYYFLIIYDYILPICCPFVFIIFINFALSSAFNYTVVQSSFPVSPESPSFIDHVCLSPNS